jgi:uncharacterized membrane protein
VNQYRGLLSLGFCLVLYTAVPICAQHYTVTDLSDFSPYSVHVGGIVLGSHDGRPALWEQGQITYLPDAGAGGVVADMNRHGEMVGWVNPTAARAYSVPAYWYQGQLFELPYVRPGMSAVASGINDHSDLVGLGASDSFGKGWRQWANGQVDILDAGRATEVQHVSIDGHGRVWASVAGFATHFSVVFDVDGSDTQPPMLGGQVNFISGVNPDGVAVGSDALEPVSSPFSAVETNLNTGATLLPPLPAPFTSCEARGINASTHSVGSCSYFEGSQSVSHAVQWVNHAVTDLNSLIDPLSGWMLQFATAISDDGYIFGSGQYQGQPRHFFLTPPPAAPPSLAIHLNQTDFRPGQTLRVALEMHNPGPLLTTDVYTLVLLPDGDQAVFLTNLSPTEGVVRSLSRDNPRTFPRLLAGVSWPANLYTTHQDAWVYTRTGLEANGTYHLIVAWTKPNSLQDGSIDEGDILALDSKAFQFTAPASNLAAKAQAIRTRHALK